MIDFNFEQNCYGCGACEYVCPTNAIKMKIDFEGFAMPTFNAERCVECGKCVSKCAYLNPTVPKRKLEQAKCMAAFRKDDLCRLKSASGGVAAVITEDFIKQNGTAIGCAWTKDFVAKHITADTLQQAECFKSSKYVQSDMLETYDEIEGLLKKNKKVLFIGTPCQTGAIRNIFGYNDNLLLIALICGGVPSPKVWRCFKEELEQKYNSKMCKVDFRHKGRYGWNTPEALYEFENGKKLTKLSFQLDKYVLQFLYGVFKRNCCYQCTYKGDVINADIILGDYWGSPEFRNLSENKGVSAIVCLTDKGENQLKSVQKQLEIISTHLEAVLHKNQPLIKSVERGGDRKGFFEELDKSGYKKAVKKFGKKTNPIKYIFIWFFDKIRLFEVIKQKIKD